MALKISSLVILSTVHIQVFPNVEGDVTQNRKTIPIVALVTSCIAASVMIIFWSIYTVSI